jgi:hypothetical protein
MERIPNDEQDEELELSANQARGANRLVSPLHKQPLCAWTKLKAVCASCTLLVLFGGLVVFILKMSGAIPATSVGLSESHADCSQVGPCGSRCARTGDARIDELPSLPVFSSVPDLVAQPQWLRYLVSVYGSDLSFPIDLNDFAILYWDRIPAAFRDPLLLLYTNSIPLAPLGAGQWFEFADWTRYYQVDVRTIWKYQFLDIPHCFRNTGPERTCETHGLFGLVEVQHACCDPPGSGFWFYRTKRSGIFYDVGNTIAFWDHGDAYSFFFGMSASDANASPTVLADVASAARARGFDSVQYTHR